MLTFFDLADEQQADILVNWLSVDDVSKLDTAVCNRALRSNFLDVLHDKCIFHELDTCTDPLSWAVRNCLTFRKASMRNTQCLRDVVRAIGAKLESLTVIFCGPEDYEDDVDNSSYDVMKAVRHKCHNLKYLRLYGFEMCTQFELVIQQNPQLSEIELDSSVNLLSGTIRKCVEAPSVHSLRLSYAKFGDELDDPSFGISSRLTTLNVWMTNLTGEACVRLCSGFANLTDLKISLLGANTDLIQIAKSCVHMQKAQILLRHTITDNEMSEVAACWKEIQWLWLGHANSIEQVCSERAVLATLRACPALQRFKNCIDDPSATWASDYDMPFNLDKWRYDVKHTLVRDASGLSGLYKLTHLFVDSLSEHGLTTVLSMCPHLHTLAIRHRVEFADPETDLSTTRTRPAEYALHHINNSSVRSLQIVNCSTLTNAHVSVLSVITELVICDAGAGLTNSGVSVAVAKCAHLSTLKLCRCIGLTHSVVLPILQKCLSLRCFYYYTHYDMFNSREETVEKKVLFEIVKAVYPHVKEFKLT